MPTPEGSTRTPLPKAPAHRIFSGVQPSGGLTLGNYLGALKRFVAEQDAGIDTIYCLVDLHALTVWQEPEELRRHTHEGAAAFIAAGIDPERSILFNQSQVAAHAELAWILNCVARMGWMGRMTQWKDKTAGKNAEAASLGLFAYPALMAADILVYRATHVPVGADQKQHIELARDIAAKFNHDYGIDFFPLPEPVIEGAAVRVMSLADGRRKMSKSDPSDNSRINLTDDADTIARKFRRARTDSAPLPATEAELDTRPEARNLVHIYAGLADSTAGKVVAEFAGQPFSVFKPRLTELAVSVLAPISGEMQRLLADRAEIDRTLARGAVRAREIADPVLHHVHDIVGLVR